MVPKLSKTKDIIFKMKNWQILAVFLSIFFMGIFLSVLIFSALVPNSLGKYSVLALLAAVLFLNRMLVVTRYGIRFTFFILFCTTAVFGPIVSFAMLFLTTVILLWFEKKPTSIDFLLNKNSALTLKRTLDYSLLVLVVVIAQLAYGAGFLQNIVQNAAVVFVLWSAMLFGKRILLGHRIMSWQSATVIAEFLINYWLVVNFGKEFVMYLIGL